MTLLAQAEVITKGTDYGFAGWILAVLFLSAFGGVAWYAKYIMLPSIAASQAAAERDQANKAELTKAVAALCTVVGDTHTLVVDNRTDVQAGLAIKRGMLLACKVMVPIMRELAATANLKVGDDLARIEGILDAVDNGSRVFPAVKPQGDQK